MNYNFWIGEKEMKQKGRRILAFFLSIAFALTGLTLLPVTAFAQESYTLSAEAVDANGSQKLSSYNNPDFNLFVTETDGALTAVLHANKDITMKKLALSKPRQFSDDDRFFANGYQSWSTTTEHKKTDNTMKAIPAAKVTDLTWQIATNNSDYKFANYGTQGLFHSWTQTYIRKAGSRNIEFYGSRSEKNGFTMFEADMKNGRFTISKDIDGLKLKAGQDYQVFDLLKETGDYDKVMDDYFFKFCGLQKPKVDRMTGYTSWYNLNGDITEETILRDLNGLDPAKDEVSIFQVDDGYEPKVGDWTKPNSKFPSGMKSIADKIHAKGYKAGLWVAPFCAASTSQVVREHPDWLVRDDKGKLVIGNGGWWGAFALDIYNPEVREYLKNEFDTILNKWGYDMVKLDFLYATAIYPRNGKTRGELMEDGCNFLREICGDKIILGCGVPLGSCMGKFEACRIGPDQNDEFEGDIINKLGITNEVPSTRYGITNSIFRRFYNGRAFANDPDVFYLRDGIKYTDEQKKLLAKINDITGSILFMSDDATTYDAKQWGWLKAIYAPKTYQVQLAEFTSDDDMTIQFTENGKSKTLMFNIANGKSNIDQVW